MQEEDIYTSLQWDNTIPNHYKKPLASNKFSGRWCLMMVISCFLFMGSLATSVFLGIKLFQMSTIAMKQQEKLLQQDRELLNFTEWKRKHDQQMKCCQTLMPKTFGPVCVLTQEECSNKGAKLLQTDSKEEMDFISEMLTKTKKDYGYWVGLCQLAPGQLWVWQDGSSLSSERKLMQQLPSINQDCAYLKRNSLFPANCSSWKYFICEMYS
ncbi:PREDICTED: C-type lectin domain family 9 member A [Elephantulus edwardii]|uniref:C-type lectin domain family 9 member A n=1 Tax=Elephantulus edwardii TaxID=28737 RepID=UPI0003F0E2C7|nr:PREDICTED: C-type lectin domain family 9 member A [Elephantulus edwardii]